MFRKPTKRSITRARRFTFHDAPMPMSSGDATIPIPPDWVGRDLVDLVGQLVEQGQEKMFYGTIEPTPRYLGNIGVESKDQIVPMQSAWGDAKARVRDQLPASVDPEPDDPEDSTTTGGTAGPGMQSECVAVFLVQDNRFGYWTRVQDGNFYVVRRDYGDDAGPVVTVGQYPMTPDSYFHFDVSTKEFRLFKTRRQQADLNRPGIAAGAERAATAGDSASRIQQINRRNREVYGRG